MAAETLEASRVRGKKGSDGVLELLVSADGCASLSSNADRLTWIFLHLTVASHQGLLAPALCSLVSCPRNSRHIVWRPPDQLAVFQGGPSRTGGKAPISESYGSSPAVDWTEKQPTGPGPEGCDENGLAAVRRLPDRSRIDSDMPYASRLAALPTAHFDRNNIPAISGTGH